MTEKQNKYGWKISLYLLGFMILLWFNAQKNNENKNSITG